jgi:hypothetical protein
MESANYACQAHAFESLPIEHGERSALTLGDAIKAGFDPGAYEWREVPEGTWEGHLDFKTWATKAAKGPLLCYFTDIRTGKHFRLSAGRPWVSDQLRYTPGDRAIDFSHADVDGQIFQLRVRRIGKGGVAWVGAIIRD